MALLIYGAYGYTGELVAAEAVRRGLRPILAGRDAARLEAGARGLETRAFALDDPDLARHLTGITVALHCAGPFRATAAPMVAACLRAGVHYLDITGELLVFEALARRDAEAKAAGVMLLPGVGFDVVPSDCLAAHLARLLPGATRLELAFMTAGGVSRGTALTALDGLGRGGAVRRGGRLVPVPPAFATRRVDFGRGPVTVVSIPWGDVATAYRSTGIPDITVYMAAPARLRRLLALSRHLGPVLRAAPVRRVLERRVRSGAPGPDAAARERGRSYLWGEVTNDAGERAEARLQGPEAYTLTAQAAVRIAEKALAGEVRPGFQTPSLAYGPDLILEVPGTARQDDTLRSPSPSAPTLKPS